MKKNKEKNQQQEDLDKVDLTKKEVNNEGDLEITAEVALFSENELLLKQIQELKNKNLILLADMENQRKRFEQEKFDLFKYKSLGILEELLPSIQLFEMTVKSKNVPEGVKNWLKGFEMIIGNIEKTLDQEGVKKIHPHVGDKLNLSLHEVIEERYDEKLEEGRVLVLEKEGYLLKDRLIIPAKVIVSTKNKKEEKGN